MDLNRETWKLIYLIVIVALQRIPVVAKTDHSSPSLLNF